MGNPERHGDDRSLSSASLQRAMRILITGGSGMLARELRRRLAGFTLVAADRSTLDICQSEAVDRELAQGWNAVINCAAMTAVDRCEQEADAAYRINAIGPGILASACRRRGIRLLHISTDYVFSGQGIRPYHEWDTPGPTSVYGQSKLAGELAVRHHCPDHLILRTSWLYGPGGPSFVHKMLELAAQDGPPVRVVQDQIGNPTSTTAVAEAVNRLLATPHAGTIHLSCEGEASWFDLACEVFRHVKSRRSVVPCKTAEFPRPAPRPANSRLEKRALRLLGLEPMPTWQNSLTRFLEEHPHG